MNDNRREFFRVNFHQFIHGMVSVNGENPFSIEIGNISAGGLVFHSSVDIPLEENVECSFSILENPFLLDGAIVRKLEKAGRNEYGVGFTVDQSTSSELFKQLNYYQIREKKGELEEEY